MLPQFDIGVRIARVELRQGNTLSGRGHGRTCGETQTDGLNGSPTRKLAQDRLGSFDIVGRVLQSPERRQHLAVRQPGHDTMAVGVGMAGYLLTASSIQKDPARRFCPVIEPDDKTAAHMLYAFYSKRVRRAL
jgi:hypothetical protein